ncbi:MAG: hypothetical protein M0Q43_05015 [Methanothrix sp.]|nr:hypothetical protein [Methanothrix sp.]
MSKLYWLLVMAAVLSSTAMAVDLTGNWKVLPDADIYIRQIDNSIWWLCESTGVNPGWTSVANGTVQGNTVSLIWVDVPKSNLSATGSLVLNITSDNELEILNQTGGWAGKNWKDAKIVKVGRGF